MEGPAWPHSLKVLGLNLHPPAVSGQTTATQKVSLTVNNPENPFSSAPTVLNLVSSSLQHKFIMSR